MASVRETLVDHGAFVAVDNGFTVDGADLDNRVDIIDDNQLRIVVRMPTLDAVITGTQPAEVVVDSWYDTLRDRLVDGYSVTNTEAVSEAVVARNISTVEVTYRIRGEQPRTLVDDAKALVDFAVGTFLQSAIPGYEYEDPLRGLLDRALQRGSGGVDTE